jgi:hypothetical protein
MLSCLNHDDWEFLVILFFYKFAYNFLTEKDSNFFSLQNLFRKINFFLNMPKYRYVSGEKKFHE